jgi:signal transduction histidine kinase
MNDLETQEIKPESLHPHHSDSLHRYARLLELSTDLASILDLDILFRRIVDAARELTECEAASLLLYDAKDDHLFFQAATDLLEEGLGRTAVPTDNSIAGWIFTHNEPLLVDDALQDPRFFREVDAITRFETRSILGVPMRTKDKTLGVIEAINKESGNFDQEDRKLLESLALQAAISIENSTLFQQSDIVAEMVHELRTPLTALTAVANLLQRPDLPNEQRLNLARTLHTEVNRLNGMTTDFLEISRLETGRTRFYREPVHLGGLIEECLQVIRAQAEEEGILLEVNIDRSIIPVQGDRNRLKQVLLNLLTNAIKYNQVSGKVVVRLKQKGESLLLSIEDSGRGIPEEAIPHVFERFYRVPDQEKDAPGTGLGLAIAKRIIESHGGTISVESQVGSGSTFFIRLPCDTSHRMDTKPLSPHPRLPN